MIKDFNYVEKRIKSLKKIVDKDKNMSWLAIFFLTLILYIGGSFIRDAIAEPYINDSTTYIAIWVIWIVIFLVPIIFKLDSSLAASIARKNIESLKTDLIINQNKRIIFKIENTLKEELNKLIELKEDEVISDKKLKALKEKYLD